MAYRTWFAFSVAVLSAGCSIQPLDDQQPAQPRKDLAGQTVAGGQDGLDRCRFALGKGCFDGHVSAKTTFLVDGKQFFNADDLGTRFHELLSVSGSGKALTSGDYRVTLTTPVDNASFYQDFTYDLTGPTARTGKLRSDGNFGVDDLPEGHYELRLSKPVRFELSAVAAPTAPTGAKTTDGLGGTPPSAQTNQPTGAAQPQQPSQPAQPQQPSQPPQPPTDTAGAGGVQTGTTTPAAPATGAGAGFAEQQPEAAQLVKRTFCATIYVDATVEVRGGQRTYDNFGEYRLHVTDDQCSANGSNSSLTLTP